MPGAITQARPTPRPALTPGLQTPFLEMGPAVRAALLFYLFAYRVVFPTAATLMAGGAKDLLELRILSELILTILMAYPFIFYRRDYGWLHPLVLPTLFQLAKTVAKNPFTLIAPFDFPVVDFTVETKSLAAVLALPPEGLAWYRLELSLINCLAQATYLLFFLFAPTFRIPRIRMYKPPNIAFASATFIGVLVGAAFVFVLAQGGITELLVAMRGGRRTLMAGSGHLVFAGVAAPMIACAWFAYLKRPWTNWFFLAGLGAAFFTSLIVSGSRSSIIMPALAIVLLWWSKRGKALILPAVLAGLFGLIIIGAFGSIRQDYGSDTVDTSLFNPLNMGATLDRAIADIEDRDNEESALATVAGAHQKGYLFGRSYVNASLFWVPRALWPDKPSGSDAYNMWINFRGNPVDSELPEDGVFGIPVNAQSESFWNFGLPGVFAVFALLGIFHASCARAAFVYASVPFFWVIYIFSVIYVSGTAATLIDLFRNLAVLILFGLWAGIFRIKGADRDREQVSYAAMNGLRR